MTYNIVFDVAAPIEAYDGLHAAVHDATGLDIDGLLVHVAQPTDTGFRVLVVWESKEQCDRFNAEIVGPIAVAAGGTAPADGSPPTEFELRGLVLPGARLHI